MLEDVLADGNTRLTRRSVTVSDGVDLSVYDFCPENTTPGKPVLVFVPGWVSLISGWVDVLKVLAPHMRILYLETREKKSAFIPPGPLPEFTLERMSLDLVEVLDKTLPKDTPFYMSGSSLGSSTILDYLNRPGVRQPVASILVSPVTGIHFPFWAKGIIRFFPPSAYTLIKYLVIFYLTRFRVDKREEPEQAEKYRGTLMAAEPARLKANAKALSGYSVWERLETIPSQVVLVGARTDKLHGLDELKRMVDLLPSSRLVVMDSNRETHSEALGYFLLDDMLPGRMIT